MVLDGMEVHPAQTVVVWADIRKCFQTDMTVFMQRKMFLLSQRSVRETCSHAWVENVGFFFVFTLHMLHMAQGWEGGRGGCVSGQQPVDSSAGYRWTPRSLRLAACHFGIVSAIESLFNLFRLRLWRARTGHPFRCFISGAAAYFPDGAGAAARPLMNSLIREEFLDPPPPPPPQLILLSKQMRATGGWAQSLDVGVTVCVHTNTAEVRPLWRWPYGMLYMSRDCWGQISTHQVKRLTTPNWGLRAAEKLLRLHRSHCWALTSSKQVVLPA